MPGEEKTLRTDTAGGIKRPKVRTGKADPLRAREAKRATGTGTGFSRNAGMLLDMSQQSAPYRSGYILDTYRSSYAYGLGDRSGTYDIPTYFVRMNEQNGGILYWPVTLREKYSWFRYFARTDAYVGRAMELLSDLPMSKLTLNMQKPKGKLTKAIREEILEFFEYQLEVIGGFSLCQSTLWEWNMLGNVYIFNEWDEKKKMWARAIMLPPEEVGIFQYPFSDNKRVEYRPERLIALIKSGSGELQHAASTVPTGMADRSDMEEKILENVPKELVEMVKKDGCIVMDTDPSTGSFVHHIARRRSPYLDLGASVLERILVPMLQKEHFRYTQLSLASRNMTPKNLITAPGLLPNELDDLRAQVDLSYLDPEYSIITNYQVEWNQIGTTDRLLDLDREYERIEQQVFAAMGVTRELLTGEGTFTGSKITVDILNTMFLLTREVLREYLEKKLFIPVCEAHGWFEEGKNGIKKYWYPKVGFNRLTIRDNAEVFDSLFQLYQKGSLPVDIIYELFNLNSDEIDEKLHADLFTVKDSTFNRVLEEASTETGRALVERTDIVQKLAKYLKLEYTEPPPEAMPGMEGAQPGMEGMQPGMEGMQPGVEEAPVAEDGADAYSDFLSEGSGQTALSEEDKESLAEEVAQSLPPGASDEQIQEAIDKKAESKTEE